MNIFELLVTATPFAAGAWAAWALPRWAGERPAGRRPESPETPDWTADDLPSRPYRDLSRIS
jgi:hypothetical protein